jgi:hypothetical protein
MPILEVPEPDEIGLSVMPQRDWDRLAIQKQIDDLYNDLGTPVKICYCGSCVKCRLCINVILGLCVSTSMDGIEYRNERKGHFIKDKGL